MFRSGVKVAAAVLALLVSGCASMQDDGGTIHMPKLTPKAGAQAGYNVPVHMAGYKDGREAPDLRHIGTTTARIFGHTGPELAIDRDVTAVVEASMQKRLNDDGLRFVGEGQAKFQLSGVVKVLNVDIKERDKLDLAIESTLTEIGSGRVIWSGVVAEKKERFAGVSGNSKGDVADFLQQGLNAVSAKTSESILSVLMATRPELFGMLPGVKPVLGVTVTAAATAPAAGIPVPATAVPAVAADGKLVLRSSPERVKVYVDDVYYGLTPIDADMPAGIYTVRFELDGYQKQSQKLSVRAGQRTELEVKLQH
ncbi:MAG: PEGA domain-containing protein [Pseudomonadota bacterium]